MAWTPHSRPPSPRSGRARPGLGRARTHLGPACHPTRPSATGYSGPNASPRNANCGRAGAVPGRCRCVPPGCHIILASTGQGRAVDRRRGLCRFRQAPRPADPLVARQDPRATRGHLDWAESSAGGEGLPFQLSHALLPISSRVTPEGGSSGHFNQLACSSFDLHLV